MYSYIPSGVCSRKITFDIIDGRVYNIAFEGGCNGNGKGVAALAEGQPVGELIKLLSGIECKQRGTSCPAQLAKALRQIVENGETKEEQ